MLAPIVLFVYSRYEHTKQVVEALTGNKEAKESVLYVYSDAAKNDKAQQGVSKVREYIHNLADKNLFKEVIICEADKNKGLANSVIGGVSEVIKKYKRVIVVEDDAVCANDFLEFMNNALDFYEDNKNIWYIGGYTPDIKIPDDYNHDVFVNGRGSSYAWATWEDRWNTVDWKVSDYSSFKHNFIKRHRFNKYGQDRSSMLDAQMHGKIDSWAIRFSYSMFNHNMLAVLPIYSRIKSIGNDGSGTHCENTDKYDVEIKDYGRQIILENIDVDKRISRQCAEFFKSLFIYRMRTYIKTVILNK